METKTYVFGDGSGSGNSGMWGWLANLAQNRGVDPNVLAMMNNNGGWGNGMGNWIWFFFIILLWGGNGWGGFGRNGQGTADLASLINGDNGRDLLMQAINGNGTAISQLASTLNCSVGQIQQSINGVMTQLQSLGNQVGMSGQAIINAIQSGNCSIERQLAQCCCDNRLLTTQQGYENRIAISEQTNVLGSKIDQQSTMINDKFCQLEQRELQNKIDALREERSSLLGQISQANQTAQIGQYIAQAVNPVNAAVAALQSEIDGIKCKLPQTQVVPAQNGVYLSPCQATLLGLNGLNGLGAGTGVIGNGPWL
nr:MAG TPA: hypothetical protein [Caudoviricetes sp.]